MIKKLKIVIAFFFVQLNCIILAQSVKLPPVEVLEQRARDRGSVYTGTHPDSIIYDDGDFDPPPAGQVMMAHWKNLGQINQKIGEDIQNAPDDATGKQSPAYAPLQTWKTLFDHFITTKASTDLLALVPGIVAYHNLPEEQISSTEMRNIRGRMTEIVYYVVEALAAKVVESDGVLNAPDLSNAVDIFSIHRLVDVTHWDPPEIPMPIDAAGIMILDAEAVATRLKAGPWQRAKWFLGGHTTAESFFSSYIGDGNGFPAIAVLKTKYTANQATIDAKFSELKTWADQQEQQAGGGN